MRLIVVPAIVLALGVVACSPAASLPQDGAGNSRDAIALEQVVLVIPTIA